MLTYIILFFMVLVNSKIICINCRRKAVVKCRIQSPKLGLWAFRLWMQR